MAAMSSAQRPQSALTLLLAIGLLCGQFASPASAQQPPFTGVAADEARPSGAPSAGENRLGQNALSADGRYIVFDSERTLLPGDTNGAPDVFLRDRHTGALTKISVGLNGQEADGGSGSASISRNGRHIVYSSCASNLIENDTFESCDIFVHDRQLGTTVRVNELATGEAGYPWGWENSVSVSADGRFVAFVAAFSSQPVGGFEVWLRDRDSDADGEFDEPGEWATTRISQSTIAGEHFSTALEAAISADGRWVAYTINQSDGASTYVGMRLLLHDRSTGTTVRVDRPFTGDGNSWSATPNFSDSGELVYRTSVQNLVPEDTSSDYDVFVVNLATLAHSRIRQTHDADPYFEAYYPAISADGRYVAYLGFNYGSSRVDTFVVDRVTGASQTISQTTSGEPDPFWNFYFPSIAADGTAIAFRGTSAILVNGAGADGIFVSSAVSMSPSTIDAALEFGTYTFDVNVPAGVAWTLDWDALNGLGNVTPTSGNGPATVEVAVFSNNTGEDRTHTIALGSQQIVIHQDVAPTPSHVTPYSGPLTGGTEVVIHGYGFREGASVTFGNEAATNVAWVSDSELTATSPPHAVADWVHVTVTNPNGMSGEAVYAFRYEDTTPPELTPTFTGTLGANGWYTSDLQVEWTVVDNESEVWDSNCPPLVQTTDIGPVWIQCSASSDGGTSEASVQIKRDTVAPTITIASPVTQTYAPGQVVALSFTCGDATSGVATCSANQSGTLSTSAYGPNTFTVTAVDYAGHATTSSVNYTVDRVTPVITWPTPAPIVFGTPLSEIQLNATAPMQGSFGYYPGYEEVLPPGTHTLTVEFGPLDTTSYTNATATVTLIVKAIPAITWPNPAAILSGAALSTTELNASTTVPGTFAYSPAAGTVLAIGTHTLTTTFTPADPLHHTSATKTVTLNVKGTPVITWADPASRQYPVVLSATQLNATASVPGTFAYTPPLSWGDLNVGVHTLSVTFTPTNQAHYTTATKTVQFEVVKGTPTITWPYIENLTYGWPLGPAQLNATYSAAGGGTLVYAPPAGTVLNAGTHTLSVTFIPNQPNNYHQATATKTLIVGKQSASVSWDWPAAIEWGTPLGPQQLNATSPVPGTFHYYQPAGTILDVGQHWLSVSFTPDNSANYDTGSSYVSITVHTAQPVITWPNPAPIVYGTSLSVIQNATANVPGSFYYPPGSGEQPLPVGTHTRYVTFTPTDQAHYGTASKSVTLIVEKRTPIITWNQPSAITYGTALGGSQLNATADVINGAFAYSPAPGTVLEPGDDQTLTVTYNMGSPNYNVATATVTIDVAKVTPAITWGNPEAIVYGMALSGTQLNASATVPGTFTYSPDAAAILPAGVHTLTTTFTPQDQEHYAVSTRTVTLTVNKATPAISWATPAAITYGTAIGATQLNATTAAAGAMVYSPASGTILNAGTRSLGVVFTPEDTANYHSASANVSLQVQMAVPEITWGDPAAITYPTPLSTTQLNATATLPGTMSYNEPLGNVLGSGTYTLRAMFSPTDSTNYVPAIKDVTLVVLKATPVITWNPANITYPATVTAQLNATADVGGSFAYSPAAGTVLPAGTHTLSVTFTPSHPFYNAATTTRSIVVAKATPVVSWGNKAPITYGTALTSTQLNATANVPGTFAYSPAGGAVLGAGTQPLSVTFMPTDAANYNTATGSQTIVVTPKALTVTTVNASKVYGQALPAFTISGAGFVNGDTVASLTGAPSFSTSAIATSAPGNYSVTPSGVASANYGITFAAGTLTISKADTTTTLTANPSPSNKNQTVVLTATVAAAAPGAGTPTGTVQFRDNGTLIGTATLVNGVATLNKSFNSRGSHPLTATYVASTNFNSSVGAKTHQVN
jgi:hypothetical protein